MLLPVIGIIQVGVQAHADRYTYLPQIGLTVALTWLVADNLKWRLGPIVGGLAAVAGISLLAMAAWRQVSYWRTNESLWRHALAVTSANYVAEYNLAHVLMQRGPTADASIQESIAHSEAAIAARPEDAAAHTNLAVALFHVGRAEEAFAHWQRSLVLKPDNPEARNNLGLGLLLSGRPREAVAMWESNLTQHGEDLKSIMFSSWVLATNVDDGVRDGRKALELAAAADRLTATKSPAVWRIMAAAHAERAEFEQAKAIARRALETAEAADNQRLVHALKSDLELYHQRQPLRSKHEPLLQP
jgi:tetratricopeptide (TPR) repeat protein